MIKKNAFIALLIINLFNNGCAQNTSRSISNVHYEEYKNNFQKRFVDHFPLQISKSLDSSSIYSDMDEQKNDYVLMLFEYGVSDQEIGAISNKFNDKKIAEYKTSDSCLLIVNRFETKETLDHYELPIIKDSTIVNNPCYTSKYPIPNFINYERYNSSKVPGLNDSFTILVIESKRVKSWEKEFGMKPAPQMPNTWKNGFSKGIAISKEKKTVIYWTVIW